MKIRTCLLATIAVALLTTATYADGPFDKFLPRGRLLKKLRDDVMGKPETKEPTPAKPSDAKSQKGPTPAIRSTVQQPTQGQSVDKRNDQGTPNKSRQPVAVKSGAEGFGMVVVADKNERVIVAQVAPKGNAAEAGLVRGDVIVEAGGVELTSIEEYREIAKMLGAGDQLELKVVRRGRPGKVMLQYGQPPSLEDVEVGDVNAKRGSGSNLRTARKDASQYGGDFSFVPPADQDSRPGMRSVVERPIAPVQSRSTQPQAMVQSQSRRPVAPPQQLHLQRTLSQQQQQIQALQQQLEQMRRQQGVTGSGLRNLRGSR
jgi:membrane-associated protease RseP (regulator of RpoE activity)